MNKNRDLPWIKLCMKLFCYLSFFLGILFCCGLQTATAEDNAETYKNRIELFGSFEYVSPYNNWGDWETLSASWYRKERPDFTWYVQLQAFWRDEGNGLLATAGAYKDWTNFFYTYTDLSVGTNTVFLPQIRVDQDFNFKFGPDKKFVWVVGGTYIQYFDVHADYIVSTGLTAYLGKWVAEYRFFENFSTPGWIESCSNLFSLAYGQEGWHWTTVTFSFGKQAYLATALAIPGAVENNSYYVTLNHRQWLAKNYGVFGQISYLDLNSTYKVGGLLFGVFREF